MKKFLKIKMEVLSRDIIAHVKQRPEFGKKLKTSQLLELMEYGKDKAYYYPIPEKILDQTLDILKTYFEHSGIILCSNMKYPFNNQSALPIATHSVVVFVHVHAKNDANFLIGLFRYEIISFLLQHALDHITPQQMYDSSLTPHTACFTRFVKGLITLCYLWKSLYKTLRLSPEYVEFEEKFGNVIEHRLPQLANGTKVIYWCRSY